MKFKRVLITISAFIIVNVCLCIIFAAFLSHEGHKLPINNPSWFIKNKAAFKDRKVVICIGDSITHGQVSGNYVDMLAKRMEKKGYVFINAGINSELSYNVLNRLSEIIECDPDYVTILIGTNDCNWSINREAQLQKMEQMNLPQKPTPQWFRSNLAQIITELQKKSRAKIAILSLPPITEDINHENFIHSLTFNKIIKALAHSTKIIYLPLHESMIKRIGGKSLKQHHKFTFENRQYETYLAFFKHAVLNMNWNDISRNNGCSLLTDYVHLNDRSAAMICDLIIDFLYTGNHE